MIDFKQLILRKKQHDACKIFYTKTWTLVLVLDFAIQCFIIIVGKNVIDIVIMNSNWCSTN